MAAASHHVVWRRAFGVRRTMRPISAYPAHLLVSRGGYTLVSIRCLALSMVDGNRVMKIESLFFGDITKKAFGNSTQKLYFIRNNSFHHFYPHVALRNFVLIIAVCIT
jgi:hypothetical protein